MAIHREVPLSIKLLIVFIFLVGFVGFAFVVIDASWTGFLLGAAEPESPPMRHASSTQGVPRSNPPAAVSSLLESTRESIVQVASSKCRGNKVGYGTGFVIKPGYIATNALLVDGCGSFELIDYRGNHLKGTVKTMGNPKSSEDLAILKTADTNLPALPLAKREEGRPGEKVQAIGYPLAAMASGQNTPSPSEEGVITRYDNNNQGFRFKGMNIKPGSSGAPVFLVSSRKVIGVAVNNSWGSTTTGDGIFISSTTLEEMFRKRTGEALP